MEEQEYQEVAPAMPYRMPSDKADILEKIKPDTIVETIRNKLMGRRENPQTGLWEDVKDLKDNAITELGAWELTNLILSVANPNVSISKLKDQEIRKRAYSIMCTAIRMCLANWEGYGITNRAQITYIADIIFSISFITMKQADAEGIRKMIIGIRSESYHHSEADGNKRGMFRQR